MLRKLLIIVYVLILVMSSSYANLTLLHVSSTRHNFTNELGTNVVLMGKHAWPTLVQFNYGGDNTDGYGDPTNYIHQIATNGQNLTMLWPSDCFTDRTNTAYMTSFPYGRSGTAGAADGGNKFDLGTFSSTYFNQLSNVLNYANQQNVYVIVRLFDGYRTASYGSDGHNYFANSLYNTANNVNSAVPALTDLWKLTGNGANLTNLLANYIKHTIDAVGGFSNVLWEIQLEAPTYSSNFQHWAIGVIKGYEGTGGRLVHPVGRSEYYGTTDDTTDIGYAWSSQQREDYYMPGGSAYYASGALTALSGAALANVPVIILDTDHLVWTTPGGTDAGTIAYGIDWTWKAITRGYHLLYMDGKNNTIPGWLLLLNTQMQAEMGAAVNYSVRMNMESATTDTSVASTGYCLSHRRNTYLVYQPSNASFTVTLPSGVFNYEWRNPATGAAGTPGQVTGDGTAHTFSLPGGFTTGVLFLQRASSLLPNMTGHAGTTRIAVPQ